MRYGARVGLAASSLLLLGACGSAGTTSTVAAPASPAAPPTASPTAAEPSATPSAKETPLVEKRVITRVRRIPFRTRRVSDPTLAKGTTRVRTRGAAGRKVLTYRVTFIGGVRTGRKLLGKVVTRPPVTRVIAVGTKIKQSPQCDPNYSGCVPIASDVDCANGGGNGPAYVQGPVEVIGTDIYGLDADDDGVGCEDD
jgi:hypothetical protein